MNLIHIYAILLGWGLLQWKASILVCTMSLSFNPFICLTFVVCRLVGMLFWLVEGQALQIFIIFHIVRTTKLKSTVMFTSSHQDWHTVCDNVSVLAVAPSSLPIPLLERSEEGGEREEERRNGYTSPWGSVRAMWWVLSVIVEHWQTKLQHSRVSQL